MELPRKPGVIVQPMDEEQPFVDHYSVLGVHPDCTDRTLEIAYRRLAKQYHPDHPGTADVDRFGEVIAAYRALKSADGRAAYNQRYAEVTGFVFAWRSEEEEAIGEALSDAAAHEKILNLLYKRRRESAREPGIGHYMLQEELGCSEESFEFFVWYLKEKGFITLTAEGTLAITIVGVDHVIATSRTAARERLRLAQMDGGEGAAADP